MTVWRRLDAAIGRVEQALIVLSLALMIAAACLQIAARNLFGVGLSWSEPLVRHLVLWVGFIGAAIAAREGRHIGLEIAPRLFGGRVQPFAAAAAHAAAALVCGLLAAAAAKFVRDDAEIGSRTLFDLPAWVPEIVIPAAFAVMAARYLMHAAEALTGQRPGGGRSLLP